MIATDIQCDDSGELIIEDGDFRMGPSDAQSMQFLTWANPGSFKQSPTMGIGIFDMLNASTGPVNMNALRQRIVKNATADGMNIVNLDLTDLDLNSITDNVEVSRD